MQVGLSGYMLAAVWGGGSTNYSYPLYYDMGAAVQDHFLNWKVTSTPMHSWPDSLLTLTAAQSLISAQCLGLHSGQQSSARSGGCNSVQWCRWIWTSRGLRTRCARTSLSWSSRASPGLFTGQMDQETAPSPFK